MCSLFCTNREGKGQFVNRPFLNWQMKFATLRFFSEMTQREIDFLGHVRSECLTCTFRARLSMGTGTGLRRFLCPGQGKKGGGTKEGEPPALAGTREYKQSDRNRKQAECGLRCYGIWNVP